jgi:uncharacterized protein YhbP (UPF0306 family)
MAIRRSSRRVARERIRALAAELLEASPLCAIATVSARGHAHINTAYFAWSPRLELVWLSDPAASHSRNLRVRRAAAVAVYDSRQRWGTPDRGLQLFGVAAELSGRRADDAAGTYAARFPSFDRSALDAYRLYSVRPRQLKLFDERLLGAGVFVVARVERGEVHWERTEVVVGEADPGSG